MSEPNEHELGIGSDLATDDSSGLTIARAIADAREGGVSEGLKMAMRFVVDCSSRSPQPIPVLALHAGLRMLVIADEKCAREAVFAEADRIRSEAP